MKKVVVRLFCSTPKGYGSGVRGEGRYLLNAIEALANRGDIEVVAHRPKGENEVALDGLRYGMAPGEEFDIFLSYENPGQPQPYPKAKRYILTYWERPRKFDAPPGPWLATHPYQVGPRREGLVHYFGDKYRDLPFPAVKALSMNRNFRKKKIVWTSRDGEVDINRIRLPLAARILEMMRQDKSLVFTVLTGFEQQHHPEILEQIRARFFGDFPRDRIELVPRLHHTGFMEHVQEAKLAIIMPVNGAFGGSPLECIASGVPVVTPVQGPLDLCTEYPKFGNVNSAIHLFNKFMGDESFYYDNLNSAQTFVMTRHSYSAFRREFLQLGE